uniref:Uncharacterized protein n=1 Tax=Parascaris univalens TaxID=6257 RepID=A0A915BFN1_PARUN
AFEAVRRNFFSKSTHCPRNPLERGIFVASTKNAENEISFPDELLELHSSGLSNPANYELNNKRYVRICSYFNRIKCSYPLVLPQIRCFYSEIQPLLEMLLARTLHSRELKNEL